MHNTMKFLYLNYLVCGLDPEDRKYKICRLYEKLDIGTVGVTNDGGEFIKKYSISPGIRTISKGGNE